jgi:hypothetical protein
MSLANNIAGRSITKQANKLLFIGGSIVIRLDNRINMLYSKLNISNKNLNRMLFPQAIKNKQGNVHLTF